MTAIRIPILPVGPGTQPAEADGAELDLIAMPDAMITYAMPELPEPEEAAALPEAMAVLRRVLDLLGAALSEGAPETCGGEPWVGYAVRTCEEGQSLPHIRFGAEESGFPARSVNLAGLDAANLALVNQTLGEGEVSIIGPGLAIQESVLAGVWRLHRNLADGSATDTIEIGAIPVTVVEAGQASAQATSLSFDPEQLPTGLQNGPSLIAELNEAITAETTAEAPYVINLSLLPHTPEDLLWLAERLGPGSLTILSRGYGNCRIASTGTRHVWWVQYFNSQDQLILNTLEVTPVPVVACASREDLEDSRERLDEILQVIG